jgi:hypothetical protein
MQPYFDPTRKQPHKKWKTPKKNEDDLQKKLKNEDNLKKKIKLNWL